MSNPSYSIVLRFLRTYCFTSLFLLCFLVTILSLSSLLFERRARFVIIRNACVRRERLESLMKLQCGRDKWSRKRIASAQLGAWEIFLRSWADSSRVMISDAWAPIIRGKKIRSDFYQTDFPRISQVRVLLIGDQSSERYECIFFDLYSRHK